MRGTDREAPNRRGSPQTHKEIDSKRCDNTGVAQWIEYQPANQRVAGLIPSQGTCLGCGPGP